MIPGTILVQTSKLIPLPRELRLHLLFVLRQYRQTLKRDIARQAMDDNLSLITRPAFTLDRDPFGLVLRAKCLAVRIPAQYRGAPGL